MSYCISLFYIDVITYPCPNPDAFSGGVWWSKILDDTGWVMEVWLYFYLIMLSTRQMHLHNPTDIDKNI